MTYEEALDSLRYEIDEEGHCSYIEDEIHIAMKALEKQIPKKVNISLKGTTDWNTKCHCPVCRKDLFDGQKYCSHCGQLIDWGDTE